jgi:predicted phage terminase large subunit-like protein
VFDHLWQSWDLSFKKNARSRVAGGVFGCRGARIYLLDVVVGHLSYTETKDAIRMVSARHPDVLAKVIEDKANGPAILDDLGQEIPGLIPWPPQGRGMDDKVARASAAAPVVRAGNVYLPPKHVPWVDAFIGECASFPTGVYDDQVDMFSQAIDYWRASGHANDWLSALVE